MKRLRGKLAKEIDIKLVKKRIDDLNDLISGEQDIIKDRDGAYRFKVFVWILHELII